MRLISKLESLACKTAIISWTQLSIVAVLVTASSYAQSGVLNYKRFYSQPTYSVQKLEDRVYGVGITNYYRYTGSGSVTNRNNYQHITQKQLKLDLFKPNSAASAGKRAVVIMIPGGGRSGCLASYECSTQTIKVGSLTTSTANYLQSEGTNFNELNDPMATNLAKRGMVVASLNTRYRYHDRRYDKNGSNRWKKDDGSKLYNDSSAQFENLVVDIRRAIRWLSHSNQVNAHNIDPNNIYIYGSSGAAKMAALAAITPLNKLLADDPSHVISSNSRYQFEVNNNNLLVPQKGIRGAVIISGDTQGTKNLDLVSANSSAFMFYHGTKDPAVHHGLAETIEEKCEYVGCKTQFYSIQNAGHGGASASKYRHPDTNLDSGLTSHVHDFIVNTLDRGTADSRPSLSINSSKVKFYENTGKAQIEINLNRAVSKAVTFVAAADQMREVTQVNESTNKYSEGQYSHILNYVANDSASDGPVIYAQGTGVAFEKASNVPNALKNKTYHTGGAGDGNPIVIPSGSSYLNNDFVGKRQKITIPAGQVKATFTVTLYNDGRSEKNECFKVRLLNANGAKITNPVETITILDDDNPNAGTSVHGVCKNPSGSGGGGSGGGGGGSGGGGGGGSGGNTGTDTTKPLIEINAPRKTSSASITSTKIIVQDETAISKNSVELRSDNTAGATNLNCTQTSAKRVDCSIRINDSGTLKIRATDVAGNVKNENEYGYIIKGGTPTQPTDANVISVKNIHVDESEGVAVFKVSLSKAPNTNTVEFNFSTRNDTAIEGVDYEQQSGFRKMSGSTTSKFISIPIFDDNNVEDMEKFQLRLTNIVGADTSSKVSTASIIDNDSLSNTLAINNVSVDEGAGVAVFKFTLDQAPGESMVEFNFATNAGSAKAGSDYTAVSGYRSMSGPTTKMFVTVPIIDDSDPESDEQFTLELSQVNGAKIANHVGKAVITNND